MSELWSIGDFADHNPVSTIFAPEPTVARWLRFEGELARVEGRHGVIPPEAARAIFETAVPGRLDMKALADATVAARHPIAAFVRALSAATGPWGEYVHWGTTSQDVLDTGMILALSEVTDLIEAAARELLAVLAELAWRYRGQLMTGRTLGQHATPITFGGKVASWADQLLRALEAFRRDRAEIMVGQLGGATGQLAVLGASGVAIRDELMLALGLGSPRMSWNTARDRLVRYAFHGAMIAGAIGRMADEVVQLQRTEIQEVAEAFSSEQVGSSVMPHKRNPTMASWLVAKATAVQSLMSCGLASWRGSHERDKTQFALEESYLVPLSGLVLSMITSCTEMMQSLHVDGQRMQHNIEAGGNQAWSELLMYQLAASLGRATAHETMRVATIGWKAGEDLGRLLSKSPAIEGRGVTPPSAPNDAAVQRLLAGSEQTVAAVVGDIAVYLDGGPNGED